MRNRVKLDLRGLEEVATSAAFHNLMRDVGEAVADNVRAQGIRVGDKDGGPREVELPVKVYGPDDTHGFRTFDRAGVRVTLAHPAGLAVQAKHGALTRAAGQAGLEVRGGDAG